MSRLWLIVLIWQGAAVELPASPASPMPFRVATPLVHISSAHELPDGRVLVSDARTPALVLLDPATGEAARLGSPGAGPTQYVQPGGIYAGPDGEALVLDRAQARVMVVEPDGTFGRTYSIEVKGVRTASDGADLQRLDARGFAYFADRLGSLLSRARGAAAFPVVRFDPSTQQRETVVELQGPESRTISRPDGVTLARDVVGAPADGWGVAPDGRVAVVRGRPYRVDWIAPDGTMTTGPEIPHEVLPLTEADKRAYLAEQAALPSVGVGSVGGGGGGLAGLEPEFAPTRAPFSPDGVVVSPDAQVWVKRTRPTGATDVVYDVFDRRGRRIARLAFPSGSHVAGFGAGAVFMRTSDGAGRAVLAKYRRP
jgi:sugar lactone lactonase YvrE